MKLLYRCLCAVLGAILGSGCSDNSSEPVEYGPMPEYGVPTGRIRLAGRVLDLAAAPVPGVEVAFPGAQPDTTGADGSWSINGQYFQLPCVDDGAPACAVSATDIDGAANGGPYAPVTLAADPVQVEPGSGYFDRGAWEQSGLDITMGDAAEYGPPRARGPAPGDASR